MKYKHNSSGKNDAVFKNSIKSPREAVFDGSAKRYASPKVAAVKRVASRVKTFRKPKVEAY